MWILRGKVAVVGSCIRLWHKMLLLRALTLLQPTLWEKWRKKMRRKGRASFAHWTKSRFSVWKNKDFIGYVGYGNKDFILWLTLFFGHFLGLYFQVCNSVWNLPHQCDLLCKRVNVSGISIYFSQLTFTLDGNNAWGNFHPTLIMEALFFFWLKFNHEAA